MAKQTMQVMRVHRFGEPEQLRLEQVPRPEPRAGEVLVRVHTAGVLPAEWKIRQGLFQTYNPVELPYIPGSAFSGIIEEIGPNVTTFRRDQAVFGRSNSGTYAEYTTAGIETLALKPGAISFDEAAAISGGATTAWSALFGNAGLQAGQRVLIHGAAGGVGSFAVQFARWKGAHAIGTVSTANVDFVRSLGAETVIDYTSAPFEQAVHDIDVVLDTIGGETLQRSLNVIKPGGTLVTLLFLPPSQQAAQERGICLMRHTAIQPFPSSQLLQTIAQLIVEGQVKVALGKVFSLHEASQAHALSQSGHGRGRIVLHIVD